MLNNFAHSGATDAVENDDMFHHMFDGGSSAASWVWMVFFMVILAAIVGLMFAYVSKSSNQYSGSALDEAKRRYAKGEIDKKELDQIRKELNKT